MKNSFDSLDVEVSGLIEYDAQLALSPVKGNPFDEDNFYPADGEHLNASGIFNRKERERRRKLREKRKSDRQANRNIMAKSKADARTTQANAGKLAAESLGKESKSDIELAKALSSSGSKQPKKLSTGAKIGITVSVVAVLGVVGYFIYRAAKKK